MTVTREQLEAICGAGVANLRSWTSYVMPSQVTRITSQPQIAFTPVRLVIPSETAESWLVHDLRIGGRSQFPVAGVIRASELSTESLSLETVQAGMHVEIDVEYIGGLSQGEMFYASLMGRNAGGGAGLLPLSSGRRIANRNDRCVLLELEGCMYRFDDRLGRLDAVCAYEATTDVMDATVAKLQDDCFYMSAEIRPANPPMISLRVQALNGGHILFGVDERIGAVVFEIGESDFAFRSYCDLAGYVPTWWSQAQEINSDDTADATDVAP